MWLGQVVYESLWPDRLSYLILCFNILNFKHVPLYFCLKKKVILISPEVSEYSDYKNEVFEANHPL